MEKIKAIVIPDQAARGIDVFDEFFHFVGAAVAVEIAEAEDAAAMRIATEGTVAVAGDIEGAVGSCGDEDGVVGHWRGGEDGGVKAGGDFYVFEDVGFGLEAFR
jgi:hypothetical protein